VILLLVDKDLLFCKARTQYPASQLETTSRTNMPEGPFTSGKTENGERKLSFQVLCVGMCRTGTQCTLSYLSLTHSFIRHPMTFDPSRSTSNCTSHSPAHLPPLPSLLFSVTTVPRSSPTPAQQDHHTDPPSHSTRRCPRNARFRRNLPHARSP